MATVKLIKTPYQWIDISANDKQKNYSAMKSELSIHKQWTDQASAALCYPQLLYEYDKAEHQFNLVVGVDREKVLLNPYKVFRLTCEM